MNLAEFEFVNSEAIEPDSSILLQGDRELGVRIFRAFRTKPMLGMKQPADSEVMMGMEAVLEIAHLGVVASHYYWSLVKDTKMIQSGRTNESGVSTGLLIPFPFDSSSYKLIVHGLFRKR